MEFPKGHAPCGPPAEPPALGHLRLRLRQVPGGAEGSKAGAGTGDGSETAQPPSLATAAAAACSEGGAGGAAVVAERLAAGRRNGVEARALLRRRLSEAAAAAHP